jgi:hypothetical protein
MMDPEAADRRQHRRKAADKKLVVVPDSDGEVSVAIGDLEELLLQLDGVEDLPAALSREACDAVGRLAAWIASWERDPTKVQPVAPDGRFELIALGFAAVDRSDLELIWAAVAELVREDTRPAVVQEALEDRPAYGREPTSIETFQRLVAMFELDWDHDVDVLAQRLAPARAPGVRVVLEPGEYEAYKRVTGRILTAWHGDHPLMHYLYRG